MTQGTSGLQSLQSRLVGVKVGESVSSECPRKNLTILRGTGITGVVLHEGEP